MKKIGRNVLESVEDAPASYFFFVGGWYPALMSAKARNEKEMVKMVTKQEIDTFGYDGGYIQWKAEAILDEAKKADMDFSYISQKARDIVSFIQDVSFDIEKRRAQTKKELQGICKRYKDSPGAVALQKEIETIKFQRCPHCKMKFAMPIVRLNLIAMKIDKNLCPHCYEEVKIGG